MNVKSFRRLAFACFTIVLNTGNLYELKFVNNEDLPNTGNLDFTLRPVARIFYGEVRSNEETDQTLPGAQVAGVGRIRLPETSFGAFWKTGYFSNF